MKATKRKRDDLYAPGSQGGCAVFEAYPLTTTVWAKITSYPYFPAIVVDHVGEWETVPQSVLDLEEHETEAHGKVWLVRFYDKQRSYGWMAADKLDMLGTDDELDELYLAVGFSNVVVADPTGQRARKKELEQDLQVVACQGVVQEGISVGDNCSLNGSDPSGLPRLHCKESLQAAFEGMLHYTPVLRVVCVHIHAGL